MKPQLPAPGPITRALDEAVTMRRQMLDAGTPEAEVDHVVGQGLKALLGAKRAEPWRFYCADCRDTGWVNVTPSDDEQARLLRLYGHVELHGYVVKCEPCRWTQREREKRRAKLGEDGDEQDVATAGRTKRAGGWARR